LHPVRWPELEMRDAFARYARSHLDRPFASWILGNHALQRPKVFVCQELHMMRVIGILYQETDGTRSACIIVEYKPPHKLSILHLRARLSRADNGCMDIPADVDRITIPKDPEDKFVYISEWLVAAALTQTYGYMVENGLEYSYVVTGEAFVLLRINEDEPHALYYHLAEPNIEAEAQDGIDIVLCRTAVSLALIFCLMALDSTPRSQKWRQQTLATCSRTVIDQEEVLSSKEVGKGSEVVEVRVYDCCR
jgi:hypothetical protein